MRASERALRLIRERGMHLHAVELRIPRERERVCGACVRGKEGMRYGVSVCVKWPRGKCYIGEVYKYMRARRTLLLLIL